jgi:hypothetical protein
MIRTHSAVARPLVALAAACVATGALAQTRETQQKSLEKYQPYVGEPVERFQFWKMVEWELVAPDKVVVWTTIKDAFLITVEQPCSDLEWAKGIGVSSSQHFVHTRIDAVEFRHERCPIAEMRPIDYKRYLEDRDSARAAR